MRAMLYFLCYASMRAICDIAQFISDYLMLFYFLRADG